MLSACGRLDAFAHPAGWSKQISSPRCSAPVVAAIPVVSCCFFLTALSQPSARRRVCSDALIPSFKSARQHRSVYLRGFKSSKEQRCNSQCRVLAANKPVEEQYVFRSATSTEDLHHASVLRADAYYEVLRVLSACLLSWAAQASYLVAERAARCVTNATDGTGTTSRSLC